MKLGKEGVMIGGMVELTKKSKRLEVAIARAQEIAVRRGVAVDDWLADAIEYKNELNAGPLVDERH